MVEFNVYKAYNIDDKKEQYAELEKLGEAVKAALSAAEAYAKEHELTFYFSPEYGMGGDYEGQARGWSPSSGSC